MPRKLKTAPRPNPGSFKRGNDPRRTGGTGRSGALSTQVASALDEQFPGVVEEVKRAQRDLVRRSGGASATAKQAAAMATVLHSASLHALATGDAEGALKLNREAESCRRRVEAELTRAEKQRDKERADAEKANKSEPEQADEGSELDAEAEALLAQLNADPSQAPHGVLPSEATHTPEDSESAPQGPPRSRNGGSQ